MTQYAIVTDLNRCVGCLGCVTACKLVNNVPVGNYWDKVLRVGPFDKKEGETYPNVDMYFLTVQCQHCEHPECVSVCPTGASHKLEDGTVQVDKSKCIGCQFCVMACPYGVRYLNEDEGVVEKCTLCEQKIAQGELPQCVAQCGARARFFGDLDKGLESFQGAGRVNHLENDDYEATLKTFTKLDEVAHPYDDDNVHHLPDVGNKPSFRYILRKADWKGDE